MLVALYFIFTHTHIGSRSITDDKRHTRRVRPEFLCDVERVEVVAERLTHLAPSRIANEAVEIYVFEGDGAEREFGHKYHARDPEKENVISGFKEISRVICFKIFCRIRPTER